MKCLALVLTFAALAGLSNDVCGQTMNARRTAMGGVLLPSGGPGSSATNVAYRAVPMVSGSSSALPLPIGLVPLISDPPALDPDDPDFNIYELANLLYNPPFHLQLVEPEAPSSDIVVDVGRNYLAIELGEIANVFPENHSRLGAVGHLPAVGVGFGSFFASASGVAQYHNDLSLNPALLSVLSDGQSFQTNTSYALYDNAIGQAAAMVQLGWAAPIRRFGQPRVSGGTGLYAGVRAKVLRGLAYGDAQNILAFATRDTLFSEAPIELDYSGTIRRAGPGGGGWGHGLDLGLAWVSDVFEVGIGINDLVSKLSWRVEESLAFRDTVTQDFVRRVTAEDVPFTSELPKRGTVNAAVRLGGTLLAADVERSMGNTVGHIGVERWQGPLALRSGCSLDSNQELQYGGGVGVRLGRVGVDVAVATHSRNLSRERGVELGVGLALYH